MSRPDAESPAGRPRRPGLARPAWEAESRLQVAFVRLYTQDREFERALFRLYRYHGAGHEAVLERLRTIWFAIEAVELEDAESGWIRAYLGAVRDLAADTGLERLGASRSRLDGSPSLGERLIHTWCVLQAGRIGRGSRPFGVSTFIVGLTTAGWYPSIGRTVRREEQVIALSPGEAITVVDEERSPDIRVVINNRWDPRSETRREARVRLLREVTRQIDKELDEVEADAVRRGYEFQDTAQVTRDLNWLFQHVRHRLTYDRIADLHDAKANKELSADAVGKAVRTMARRVGVSLGARPAQPQPDV
jgi:hypothetical protein